MESDSSEFSEELGAGYDRIEYAQEVYDRVCGSVAAKDQSHAKEEQGAGHKSLEKSRKRTPSPVHGRVSKVDNWLMECREPEPVDESEATSDDEEMDEGGSDADEEMRRRKRTEKAIIKSFKSGPKKRFALLLKKREKAKDTTYLDKIKPTKLDIMEALHNATANYNEDDSEDYGSNDMMKFLGYDGSAKAPPKVVHRRKLNLLKADTTDESDNDNSEDSSKSLKRKKARDPQYIPPSKKVQKSAKIGKKPVAKAVRQLRGRKVEASDDGSNSEMESEEGEESSEDEAQVSSKDRKKTNQSVKNLAPRKTKSVKIMKKAAKKVARKSPKVRGGKREVKVVKESDDSDSDDEEMEVDDENEMSEIQSSPDKKKKKKEDRPIRDGFIRSGDKKTEDKSRSMSEKGKDDSRRLNGGSSPVRGKLMKPKYAETRRKDEVSMKEEKRKSNDSKKTPESSGRKEASNRDERKEKKELDAKIARRDSSEAKSEKRKSNSPKEVPSSRNWTIPKKTPSMANSSDNSVLPSCMQDIFEDLPSYTPAKLPIKISKKKATEDRVNRHLGLPPDPTYEEDYNKKVARIFGKKEEEVEVDRWDPRSDAFRPPRRTFGKPLLKTPLGVERRDHDVHRRPVEKAVPAIVSYVRPFITPRSEQIKHQQEVAGMEEEEEWTDPLDDLPINGPPPTIPLIPPPPSIPLVRIGEEDREESPEPFRFSPSDLDDRVGFGPRSDQKKVDSRPMEISPQRDRDLRGEEDRSQTKPVAKINPLPDYTPRSNSNGWGRDEERDWRDEDGDWGNDEDDRGGRNQYDPNFPETPVYNYSTMHNYYIASPCYYTRGTEEWREWNREQMSRVEEVKRMRGVHAHNDDSPASPPPSAARRLSFDRPTAIPNNRIPWRFIGIDEDDLADWNKGARFLARISQMHISSPDSPVKKSCAILAAGPFKDSFGKAVFEKKMKEKGADVEFKTAPVTKDAHAMKRREMAAIICYSEEMAKELIEKKTMLVEKVYIEIGSPGEALMKVEGLTDVDVDLNELTAEITDSVETHWGHLVECVLSTTPDEPLVVFGKLRFFYAVHASRATSSAPLDLGGGRRISFSFCPPEKSTPWVNQRHCGPSNGEEIMARRRAPPSLHPMIVTNGEGGPQPVPPPSLVSLLDSIGPLKDIAASMSTLSTSQVSLPSSAHSTASQESAGGEGGGGRTSRFSSLAPPMAIPPPGLVDPAMLRYMIKLADPRLVANFDMTMSIPPIPVPPSLIPLPPGPIPPPVDVKPVIPHPEVVPHPDLPSEKFFFQPSPSGTNLSYPRRKSAGREALTPKVFEPATYLKHVQALLPKNEQDELLLFVRPLEKEQQPDWDAVREHFKDNDCSSRVYGGVVSLRYTGGRAKEKAQVLLCTNEGVYEVSGQKYALGITFPVLFEATAAVSKMLVYEALKEKFGSVVEVEKKSNSPLGKPIYKAYFDSIDIARDAATDGITVEGSILTNYGAVPE